MMKKILPHLVILTLLLAGCMPPATIYSRYQFSPETTDFQTFGWEKPSGFIYADGAFENPETHLLIQKAIERELMGKGLKLNRQSPEIWVRYELIIEQKQEVRTAPYSLLDDRSDYHVVVYDYQKGTLSISMTKSSTHEVIWQGVAEALLSKEPDESFSAMINKAIARLYERFGEQGTSKNREI